MISNDPEFNRKVAEAARINRAAGDWVAPSPFPRLDRDVDGGGEEVDAAAPPLSDMNDTD